jgi:glucose/arabinose dehydrogenase
LLADPFFSIGGLRTTGEAGLLGMTFDPDYATNGFVYFSFTKSFGGVLYSQVNRYAVSADPNVVDVSTGTKLFFFRQPFANHNGGWLGFGPDGFLYFASGDGGSANDPGNRAQSLRHVFGKILRIDPDVDQFPTDPNRNYGIPAGNPFQVGSQRPEIFSYGLRNPWRCSFDRATGDLWMGDVGQGAYEEISFNPAGVAGLNFGWRPREGFADNPGVADKHPAETANPLYAYGRSLGRSVTGGYVYRGAAIPALQGYYVFGDFITGRVWAFRHRGGTISDLTELTGQLVSVDGHRPNLISSFGEDSDGELYVVDFLGEIFRIEPGT